MTVSPPSTPFEALADGSITSARGFRAGTTTAGIKASERPDLGILASDAPCVAVGTFTQNAFAAAPVILSRARLRDTARAQAIVFNSGNANACTGEQGLSNVREMTHLAADVLGISESLVLAASTGVIGQPLPMDLIRPALRSIQVRPDGGHDAALAIMTTDTRPKEFAAAFEIGGREVRIGAMTKGVGMIHPNMATMLAFVATDAALDEQYARDAVRAAVARSFNMLTIDGDTSTNDSCFLLANAQSGAPLIRSGTPQADRFGQALEVVCVELARKMAADGEGATKLIQVDVTGAATDADARAAARAIVQSNLVKAAIHGQDPNWGRIFAALGNSGAGVDPRRAALWIGSVQVAREGISTGVSRDEARSQMTGTEVSLHVDLGLGPARARAWGCDLTEAYVAENSAYTT
jgi:glutamate N-acetyltransferase/amino-acid N-acetyltransferase